MSVDISVSITEDQVDIIATPTVNIVNVTNSASIDPGLYDLSEFTNTSPNPFVRTSGLSSYVPTSRILTINGLAQDLSTDRSWTISTGLTVGTTPISSGTVGRILFEGTGNVVQESANLFWDNTNGRLGIGGTPSTNTLDIQSSSGFPKTLLAFRRPTLGDWGLSLGNEAISNLYIGAVDVPANITSRYFWRANYNTAGVAANTFRPIDAALTTVPVVEIQGVLSTTAQYFSITSSGSTMGNLFNVKSTGNVLINTTTDAGFRLDVNGTARTLGTSQIRSSSGSVLGSNLTTTAAAIFYNNGFSGVVGVGSYANSGGEIQSAQNGGLSVGGFLTLQRQGGNVLIGTATDAGFKLDVNGTARVSGAATLAGTNTLSGTTNVSGLSSNWICQYPSNATVKPLSFSAQSGGATSNNVAIQFGFNFRESGGLFTQDIFQNILYDNTTNNVVTGFEWYTHQTQAGSNPSVLAMALRGKTLSIGTNTPNASAVLQADSTTQGFLPPRMTTTQKNAIATPAAGLMVYDTTLNVISYYNGTMWI